MQVLFTCVIYFTVLNETDSAYRTRSLPAWGKGSKQRPVSTADDIEELYAKVSERTFLLAGGSALSMNPI